MKFTPFRIILTLFMVWVLVITTTAFACSKDKLVMFANDAFVAVKQAQPYISQLLPEKAALFATVVTNSEKLVAAIKASDKQKALDILADITPVLNEIVASLGANQQVLTILAVADIAFHFLVNHIKVEPTVVSASPKLGKLMQFKAQKVWGCQYRPDYHPELRLCN